MFYKFYSGILVFYGFSTPTSFSYFYANLLLVLSILNFIASLVYFEVAGSDFINITKIIAISATYIVQISHCVVLANSVINFKWKEKFYEKLYKFDREIADTFHFKVHQQAEVNLNTKILGGWIMSGVANTLITYNVSHKKGFLSLWLRVLPGILSVQLSYIHIYFYLELLKQRIQVYADILDELIEDIKSTEHQVLKMKKLYTKLIEIMDFVNESFGNDLIFLFITTFFKGIYNVYYIFLNGFYSQDFSGARDIVEVILPDAIFNITLARSCDECNFMRLSIASKVHKLCGKNSNLKLCLLVKEFSLQICHQRFELKGTRCFCFSPELLNGFIIRTASFLMLFIQFKLSE